jgi:transglutaminase-like putative cysteine protease
MARRERRFVVLALVLFSTTAHGDRPAPRPIEHELIPPDSADDARYGLRLDGDLPSAIQTPNGLVTAPDPREPVPSGDPAPRTAELAGHTQPDDVTKRFTPDTDTRRPDALPYFDPFTPSTTPFKRLVAFDDVDAAYALTVHDAHQKKVLVHATPRTDGSEDQFYGDMVLDLSPTAPTRIPSVGPGAHVVHARLGVGADDIDFTLMADSAENWFVQTKLTGRARLVLELSIARAAFGGPFEETLDHQPAYPLPAAVQADAMVVAKKVSVPRATRRETVEALVDYFRAFTESDEPLARDPGRSVYLDLALSQRGVCRHRAYAFVVTALGLGIRARMVLNEAHAWVEVADGPQWKRIDLGGAGMVLTEQPTDSKTVPYTPPPDPFNWPAGAARGDDLGRTGGQSRPTGAKQGSGGGGSGNGARNGSGAGGGGGTTTGSASVDRADEERSPSIVTVLTGENRTLRGQLLHVHGGVTTHDAPCPHARVAISLTDPKTGDGMPLGELATDQDGAYSGAFVVPPGVGLGDYDVVAAALGDGRCAASVSR